MPLDATKKGLGPEVCNQTEIVTLDFESDFSTHMFHASSTYLSGTGRY